MERNHSRYRNATSLTTLVRASGVCLPTAEAAAYDRLSAFITECEEVDMDEAEWNQSAFDCLMSFVDSRGIGT